MRIKAIDGNVENTRTQFRVDQLRGDLQFVGERSVWVRDFGLIVLADLLKPLTAGIRICRRPLDKIQQTTAFSERRWPPDGTLDDGTLLFLVGTTGGGHVQLKVF